MLCLYLAGFITEAAKLKDIGWHPAAMPACTHVFVSLTIALCSHADAAATVPTVLLLQGFITEVAANLKGFSLPSSKPQAEPDKEEDAEDDDDYE